MKLIDWLNTWRLGSLKINMSFLEAEIVFSNQDRKAAWELYVELLTRITTQPLSDGDGDEISALDSVHSIFPITRQILKTHGADCVEFTKIAVVVLNQIIRPFTAKWHKKFIKSGTATPADAAQFREEMEVLQQSLRDYTRMLSSIAGVEDLTNLAE